MRSVPTALLTLVAAYACSSSDADRQDTSSYVSERYGFSFAFPDSLDLREYIPESISVGRADGEAFDARAEVVVERGDGDDFESFVLERARVACAADGPDRSLSCGRGTEQQPFTTAEGVAGTVYWLEHRTTRPGTGEVLELGDYGPIYMVELPGNQAPEAATHLALIVRAPVALSPEEVDESLIREIAESIRVDAE